MDTVTNIVEGVVDAVTSIVEGVVDAVTSIVEGVGDAVTIVEGVVLGVLSVVWVFFSNLCGGDKSDKYNL